MIRALLCSLAGAGSGFLVGCVTISLAAGPQPTGDTGPVILFVGVFLAGAGAIAGAIIGGAAELREFFTRKNQAQREAQDRHESE